MPGHGTPPKPSRRRANAPTRGEWRAAPGLGWQHGPIPACPERIEVVTDGTDGTLFVPLGQAAREAWTTWMQSWFAAHWTPDNLPGLRHVVLLYDQVERGEYRRIAELRVQEDTYGITPKGQQDRRWAPPRIEVADQPAAAAESGRYGHLRAVKAVG